MRAAIEVEHLAGQPRRLRGTQEKHCVRDIFGSPRPAQRGVLQVVVEDSGDRRGGLGERCVDEPRGDGVDPDAAWCELQRRDLG